MTVRHATAMTALALSVLAAAGAARAQATDAAFKTTTLNLSAQGEIKAKPDMASLVLGVMTEAPTAAAASQDNAARMTGVMAALRKAGVAEADIRTAGLSLNARYRNVPNQPPEQTGYQASNTVTVTVRDVAKAGPLMDAAVAAGANQVRGVSFQLSEPAPMQNAAREMAVKALDAKAQLYARATGYRIVRLVTLSEGGNAGYIPPLGVPPVMMRNDVVVSGSAVSPGELTVRADVSAIYEMARP